MTVAPTYEVLVDWDAEGDFDYWSLGYSMGGYGEDRGYGESGTEWSDITGYVQRISIDFGRDHELGAFKTGKCEIVLDNTDLRFSPENTGGDLYGYLLPWREIIVRATYSGSTYGLFRGYIKRLTPHPGSISKEAYIEAVDGFELLRLSRVTTELYVDQDTGTLIGNVLDAVGWPSDQRSLDDGADNVPWFWGTDANLTASYLMDQLVESERGVFYFDGDGYAIFEDRHHRIGDPHRTSQYTCNNTMIDLSYDYSDEQIFNDIRVRAFPRTLAASLVDVWTLDETPAIASGASVTYWVAFTDPNTEEPMPCQNITDPVSTTDYTANTQSDGGGADKTAQISIAFTAYAQSAKLVVTNNDAGTVYITLLKVRAKPLTAYNAVTSQQADSTSQSAYMRRTLIIDLPLQSSTDTADGYATYLLRIYKDPNAQVSISLINADATTLVQQLGRKISDLITVQETDTAVNHTFFIEGISHAIDMAGNRHQTTWALSKDNLTDWGYWILGTSELDTETRLAY